MRQLICHVDLQRLLPGDGRTTRTLLLVRSVTGYFKVAPRLLASTPRRPPTEGIFTFHDDDASSLVCAWKRARAYLERHDGCFASVSRSPRISGPWDGLAVIGSGL